MKIDAPVPDDFNEMGREEIERLFCGDCEMNPPENQSAEVRQAASKG